MVHLLWFLWVRFIPFITTNFTQSLAEVTFSTMLRSYFRDCTWSLLIWIMATADTDFNQIFLIDSLKGQFNDQLKPYKRDKAGFVSRLYQIGTENKEKTGKHMWDSHNIDFLLEILKGLASKLSIPTPICLESVDAWKETIKKKVKVIQTPSDKSVEAAAGYDSFVALLWFSMVPMEDSESKGT